MFVASDRCDSAQGLLHRSNIALEDFMLSLDDMPIGNGGDNFVPGASQVSSARLCAFLDLAVNLAEEQVLGVVLQRIVDQAAHGARRRCAALEVYDLDGRSVVATFFHGVDVGHGVDVAAAFRFPIERGTRHYGSLALFEPQTGASALDADPALDAEHATLIRMLASFAACAIESADVVASERVCADAAAVRIADDLRQLAGQELRAAVTAAQDDERVEVSRKLGDEIGHALDSVLRGLHRISSPRDSSIEIPPTANPVDELRELIADALCRTRRMAFELRMLGADEVA